MDVQTLIGQASQYLNQGDNKTALRFYREALVIDPQCSKALLGCGFCLANMENFQEAIEYFSQAIQLDPTKSDGFALRSLAFFRLDDLENALTDCNQAINLEPNVPTYYQTKAEILLRLNCHAESLQYFQKVLKFNPEDSKALEAVRVLSGTIIAEKFLPSLEEFASKIDESFQAFDQDHRSAPDEDRENSLREIMIPICSKSTELVIDVLTQDIPLEVLLVYSYIQGVSRGCGAVVDGVGAGRKMLNESIKFFNQAEILAEGLENFEMMKRIHLKRGAVMFSLFKVGGSKEYISSALESYKWLKSNSEILNAVEIELLTLTISEISVGVLGNNPSSDTDEIDVERRSDIDGNSEYFNKINKTALGIGALGLILLIAGQWFFALICFGYTWYSWKKY